MPAFAISKESVDLVKIVLEFTAPFLGAFLGYWLRGRELQRSEHGERVNEISRELEALCSVSASYWSRDTLANSVTELDIAQEGEMLGRIHAVNVFVEDVAPAIETDSRTVARGLVIQMRQAVTGGTFAAGNGHSRSATAISSAFRSAAELRALLHKSFR